jgi:hypothetical protein
LELSAILKLSGFLTSKTGFPAAYIASEQPVAVNPESLHVFRVFCSLFTWSTNVKNFSHAVVELRTPLIMSLLERHPPSGTLNRAYFPHVSCCSMSELEVIAIQYHFTFFDVRKFFVLWGFCGRRAYGRSVGLPNQQDTYPCSRLLFSYHTHESCSLLHASAMFNHYFVSKSSQAPSHMTI